MIIDVHSHLNDPGYGVEADLRDGLPQVLERMRAADVATIVVGTDKAYSERAVALAREHPDIWATVGTHPVDNVNEFPLDGEWDYEWYKELAKDPKVVAIGECGLDYYRVEGTADRVEGEMERQKVLFKKQIELALELDLPLMLHVRDKKGSEQAYDDTIEILNEYILIPNSSRAAKPRGNVHFFAGSLATARKFWDLGFTTSFTGVITFTSDYDEVIREAPLDMIMAETDCPWVLPEPHRSKDREARKGTKGRTPMKNEPSYVTEVIKQIAKLRGLPPEEIAQTTTQNASRLFNLKT